MEFQVQGSVLVDGEWVSRSADVYQIMSQTQQEEDVDMEDVAEKGPHEIPEIGLLSKTVVESPLYHSIIPANIRHKDIDDVVFVGETFVQLKEICGHSHLRHVATKSDFKGKILAAKAFGDPRKVQINTSEQSPLLNRASLHHVRSFVAEKQRGTLPLEVIVLTLSSSELMFLWAKNITASSITFAQNTIQLPSAASRFNRPGPFMAIEPRCRAIAVAAAEGCFMLYKTKSMDAWRRDFQAGHDEAPIIEEAQYPIDGRIMHMDFLSAGAHEEDPHVVLVFIVVHEGKTKIETYDWNFESNLDAMPRRSRSILDFDNRNPSLLIPLTRTPDFLLVHSEYISVCTGVLAGPPTTWKASIPAHLLKSLHPGSNIGIPLFVQWDRAPRNPDFAKEAIYLGREDGQVLYVELGGQSSPLEISDAGSWPSPVDTAFACLKANSSEFAQSYPDVLVAGGLGSDGYLCKVGAWPKEYPNETPYSETNMFGLVESIPSWAPITDMAVARLENIPLPYDRSRASVFVSNGKAPFGVVSQLRRGLRLVVDETFGGLKGSTGLWLVDYGRTKIERDGKTMVRDYATFVVNVPGETLVLRASRTQEAGLQSQYGRSGAAADSGVWETEQPTHDDLIRRAETISASAVTAGLAVHVSCYEARIVRRSEMTFVSGLTFPSTVLGAATKPGLPCIVVALHSESGPILQIIPISSHGTFATSSEKAYHEHLAGDPTYIDILVSDIIGPFVFVGIEDVGFSVFSIKDHTSLDLIYHDVTSARLKHRFESVALLKYGGHEKLLCGTRDGLLISMDFEDIRSNDVPLPGAQSSKKPILVNMGTSPVYIRADKTDCSMAFVACGADFCRVYVLPNDLQVHIDSIWLHNPHSPIYLQGALNAIDQIPRTGSGDYRQSALDGYVFAVFGEQMVYAHFNPDEKLPMEYFAPEEGKVVPRKLPTTGTPAKIMVAEDLPHHMIVVTSEFKEERSMNHKYRVMLSNIRIIDLLSDVSYSETEVKDEPASTTPKNKLEKTEVQLKHYERVYSMVRWVVLGSEDRQHALVVVGTGITESSGKETGRRLIINVGKSGLTLKDKKRFDQPVRCIAVYDNQHIISIIGSTVKIEQIERSEAARWKTRGQTHLPSPGVHMTVSDNVVYVSTSHDSHICFLVSPLSEPEGETTFEFKPFFSDSRQRPSLRHLTHAFRLVDLMHPENTREVNVLLLTDKSTSVTGLTPPQLSSSDLTTSTTIFEACLPRSVIRIQRGNVRPPWRRKHTTSEISHRPLGVIDDDFLGACTDGTIYNFAMLHSQALHLLRFIQNLIEEKRKRDPELQHSTVKYASGQIHNLLQSVVGGSPYGNIRAKDVDLEMQTRAAGAPRFRHVDGDLLNAFVKKGGNLAKLVTEGCDKDVKKVFLEKAAWLGKLSGGVKKGDTMFDLVEEWLKELVMPLL